MDPMSQSSMPGQNALMPQTNGLTASVPGQQLPMQGDASTQLPTPQPKLSQDQLQRAAEARRIAINNMIKTMNDQVLMKNPDKLQKSLLGGAADVYKALGEQGDSAELISHVMDIMKDPRGPAAAMKDRLVSALSSLGDVDLYSRQNHGVGTTTPPTSGAISS